MQSEFLVFIDSAGSNIEEWRRALGAPRSELRIDELTEEQKRVAGRFRISYEDYARGLLAHRYGRIRRESEGKALGQHAVALLCELGEGYSLRAVTWDGLKLRWMLRIQTPKQVVDVPVGFELAEDVVDSGVSAQIESLRSVLLEGLGRRDKVA